MSPPPFEAAGLGRFLPGPGWVVLDAARDQGFTGELVVTADEPVRVYFDRGRIYLAERASDPPLGERLVRTGALTAGQLEHGRVRITDAGRDIEHLGRLFDRVPTVSRDAVLAVTDLMNEQTVAWLAVQQVRSASATPYRHHESGIHGWSTRSGPDLAAAWSPPVLSLSSTADVEPVEPPDQAFAPPASEDRPDDEPVVIVDDLVDWDEPEPFDGSSLEPIVDEFHLAAPPATASSDVVSATVTGQAPLVERFEIIWPSGEVDDLADAPPDEPDLDAGPPADSAPPPDAATPATDLADEAVDPATFAVRRAVATIDTGSLAARRRLVESTPFARSAATVEPTAADDLVADPPADAPPPVATDEADASPADGEDQRNRARALRRMIGGLRRD